MKQVAWSYSALKAFEDCGRRYFLTKVSKEVKEQMTPQTTWGNSVHKALEYRVSYNRPLPVGMEQFEPIMSKIMGKAANGGVIRAEKKMALNRNLVPVEYFAPDVWVRGITDVTIARGPTLFNGDYKTGKRDPVSAQLRLSAALVMAHAPVITKSVNAFIWLKTGQVDTETVTRKDLPAIWQEFMPRVQRLEIAFAQNKFLPKPSGLCRNYCPCTTCEYHGK
jgi:hypothetical protein